MKLPLCGGGMITHKKLAISYVSTDTNVQLLYTLGIYATNTSLATSSILSIL